MPSRIYLKGSDSYDVAETVDEIQQKLNKVLGESIGGPFVKFTSASGGVEVSFRAEDVLSVDGLPDA